MSTNHPKNFCGSAAIKNKAKDAPVDKLAKTYIVIPAYNESAVIREVIKNVQQFFSNIIVVNDGSTDSTSQVLKDLDIILINHSINLGQGAALQTGITYALMEGAEWIITFDSDGQHRCEDAIAMLKTIQQSDCDVFIGSRFLGDTVNMPASRKVLLKAAVKIGNIFKKRALTDAHNGLRVLSRKAAESLDITQNQMAHASQIIQQLSDAGMSIGEVPVTIKYTDYSLQKGQSSINALNIIIDLLAGRFTK